MDLFVCDGRPVTKERRLAKEVRTYDLLDKLKIPFKRIDHEVAMTIADCDEIDHLFGCKIYKNLFLRNSKGDEYYMVVMPGNKKFRTAILSKQLGTTRLSFADEKYMEDFLDLTPGSVTVMGLMNDHDNKVKLVIDKELLNEKYFACHPCINTSSIRMLTSDVIDVFLPAVHHEPVFVDLGDEYL